MDKGNITQISHYMNIFVFNSANILKGNISTKQEC